MLVNNTKPNLLATHGKHLKPGVNQVDPKWWAKVRKHPTIAARLEKGSLVEEMAFEEAQDAVSLGDEGAEQAAVEHIGSLSVNHAKALIKDTIDMVLLKAWKKFDDRKGVKTAVDEQLGKLTAEPEIRDRSQVRQISTGKGPQVINVQATPGAKDD